MTDIAERRPIIVFDLDGTLVDTSPDIHAALNAVLARHDRSVTLRQTELMIGGGLRVLFERALVETGLALDGAGIEAGFADFLGRYCAAPAVLSANRGFVVDAADALRDAGARLAICTNKAEDIARDILARLGLAARFSAIIGHLPDRPKKPEAAPLLLAIEAAGGSPAHAVMIGDSQADIGAARAAGIPVILVPGGYGSILPEDLYPDRWAGNTSELLAAIKAVLA